MIPWLALRLLGLRSALIGNSNVIAAGPSLQRAIGQSLFDEHLKAAIKNQLHIASFNIGSVVRHPLVWLHYIRANSVSEPRAASRSRAPSISFCAVSNHARSIA